jgi:uncharacterized protein YegL
LTAKPQAGPKSFSSYNKALILSDFEPVSELWRLFNIASQHVKSYGETVMTEQIAFGTAGFADNPEPRCPCLLLLDVSGSMAGQPISELNAGLIAFKNELATDALAMKRVEVGILTFGPVQVTLPFQSPSVFYPPTLSPQGDTPMGAAIKQGLNMLRQRKDEYRSNGISYYRPWIFLITDGSPTDEWQSAAAEVRKGEYSKSFAFFAVGVQDANMRILSQISVREPLRLDGLRFRDLFIWLSTSLRQVSQSTPGMEVPLQSPQGWASV